MVQDGYYMASLDPPCYTTLGTPMPHRPVSVMHVGSAVPRVKLVIGL